MFKQNRCKICGYKISNKWNYCPNCGSSLKGKFSNRPIFNFFGFMEDFLDLFSKTNEYDENDNFNKLTYRKYSKAVEPKTKERRIGKKQVIEIFLPDVKSENDINITKFEQSYEVRAYAGNKMYFKIIPSQEGSRIIKSYFNKGILRIEID